MSLDETYAKMQAEKQFQDERSIGQAPQVGDMCCETTEATKPTRQYPENTIVELRRRADALGQERSRMNRVRSILERHPEFLEFLEVLRSGLV